MVLRKITIDNSVKYIVLSEQTRETDSKPNTIKSTSLNCKQNEKVSQNNKNFLQNITAEGFRKLE